MTNPWIVSQTSLLAAHLALFAALEETDRLSRGERSKIMTFRKKAAAIVLQEHPVWVSAENLLIYRVRFSHAVRNTNAHAAGFAVSLAEQVCNELPSGDVKIGIVMCMANVRDGYNRCIAADQEMADQIGDCIFHLKQLVKRVDA